MERGDGETGEGHAQQEHSRCQLGEVKVGTFLTNKKRDSFISFKTYFFGGLAEIVFSRANIKAGRTAPNYQLTIEDNNYILELNALDLNFYQQAPR